MKVIFDAVETIPRGAGYMPMGSPIAVKVASEDDITIFAVIHCETESEFKRVLYEINGAGSLRGKWFQFYYDEYNLPYPLVGARIELVFDKGYGAKGWVKSVVDSFYEVGITETSEPAITFP